MNINHKTIQYVIEKPGKNFERHLLDLEKIYTSNGWGNNYPKTLLQKMFLNSYHLIAVSATGAIGFLRAFTDGICVTHLSEVLVLPEYQNIGVGGDLIKQFLNDLSHTTIYAETLSKNEDRLLLRHGFAPRKQLAVYARKKCQPI